MKIFHQELFKIKQEFTINGKETIRGQ